MINMTQQDKEPNLNNFEIPGFSSKAKREKDFSNKFSFFFDFFEHISSFNLFTEIWKWPYTTWEGFEHT
jgi:hypothetical protein